MKDFIQIEERNVLKFGIKNAKGEDTGLVLKFDLQDIELPLRISKCEAMHRKNVSVLRQMVQALEKQEDKKGKYLLSWKEEEKIKILKDFYKKEEETIELIIGEGMVKKILDALDRKPYYDMFDDIIEGIEPVLGIIEKESGNLLESIKKKYGANEDGVI